jgi:hypothetical protein
MDESLEFGLLAILRVRQRTFVSIGLSVSMVAPDEIYHFSGSPMPIGAHTSLCSPKISNVKSACVRKFVRAALRNAGAFLETNPLELAVG